MEPSADEYRTAPLGADFHCTRCGYEMGGAISRICPECGREATELDATWDRHRRVIELRRGRILKRFLMIAACWAAIVMTSVALLLRQTTRVEWLAVIVSGVLAAWPMAAAGVVCLFTLMAPGEPRPNRRILRLVWAETSWWLHGPGLAFPAIAVPAALTKLPGDWLGNVLLCFLICWCIGCLAALGRFHVVTGMMLRATGLWSFRTAALLMLWGVVAWLASCATGLCCMAVIIMISQ